MNYHNLIISALENSLDSNSFDHNVWRNLWKSKVVPTNFLFSGKGPWNIKCHIPEGLEDIGSQIKQNNNLNVIQKLICFKEKDLHVTCLQGINLWRPGEYNPQGASVLY